MSLAKWLAKNVPEMAQKAGKFASDNKGMLAGAAAIPATYGAYEVAQPMIDDFMTDQAIDSMKRSAKNALVDTVDYADKHPYMASALMGGAGLAGAELGDQGFAGIFDSLSPFKVGSMLKSHQNKGHR